MRLLGITDCVNTCDCCGRTNLKCTVAFDADGEIVYYGRICATRWYGKKSTEINKELKDILSEANKEANAIWRSDAAYISQEQKIAELNKGPWLEFSERKKILDPYFEAASLRKVEIKTAIAPKYMVKADDIYLW